MGDLSVSGPSPSPNGDNKPRELAPEKTTFINSVLKNAKDVLDSGGCFGYSEKGEQVCSEDLRDNPGMEYQFCNGGIIARNSTNINVIVDGEDGKSKNYFISPEGYGCFDQDDNECK